MLALKNSGINRTSHRVTLGPTHHLPVVQPLGRKHLVEPPKRELPLLEDTREPAGSEAPQAPLQPQLMLLLRPELPSPESPHHRAAAAPPLLGMTRWAGNTTPLVWSLTPAQLNKERKWVYFGNTIFLEIMLIFFIFWGAFCFVLLSVIIKC